MIDFGLRGELIPEAKMLGWKDCGVVSGRGEIRKGVIAGKEYKVCYATKPEVARKNRADILALDFEDLVFDLVIARNNTWVEFDLGEIVFGENRMRALQNFQKSLLICRKVKNKILVSTRAEDVYGLRSSKDIQDFLLVLGMTQEEVSRIRKNGEELLNRL